MTAPAVKICGIRDSASALTAARAGATHLGFVFFRKSPRFLTPEAAEDIIMALKEACFDDGVDVPGLVGLFVDAGEKELAEAAPLLTHFQFHGHEDADRCADMGAEFGIDIIKAIPVAGKDDIALADHFQEAADLILFDAKPPPGATRPGGLGAVFDWSVLADYKGQTPYLVAGGLTPDNAATAIAAQKDSAAFFGLDVSSGVETAPGKKDPALIEAFIKACRA